MQRYHFHKDTFRMYLPELHQMTQPGFIPVNERQHQKVANF